MSEHVQIQTYATCTQQTLQEVLQRYQNVIAHLALQSHFFSSSIKGSKKASNHISSGCDMLYIAKNTEITAERK